MKPSTKKKDKQIWQRWISGDEPKDIRTSLNLSRNQFYKALAREKCRRGLDGRWKPGSKKEKKGEK